MRSEHNAGINGRNTGIISVSTCSRSQITSLGMRLASTWRSAIWQPSSSSDDTGPSSSLSSEDRCSSSSVQPVSLLTTLIFYKT